MILRIASNAYKSFIHRQCRTRLNSICYTIYVHTNKIIKSPSEVAKVSTEVEKITNKLYGPSIINDFVK